VVTGATLGLMQVSTTDQGILLVPAWLFHLRGEPTPMAIVAIDRVYLVDSGIRQGSKPATGSGPASVRGGSRTPSSTAITVGPTQVPASTANGPAVKPAR
jgi:hypothetical protein